MKIKFCQSCGMPMEMDPKGSGTEVDNTMSELYCSYCYEKGKFKDNFDSHEEMVVLVKNKLSEDGVGKIRQWFYTIGIKKLERWKK